MPTETSRPAPCLLDSSEVVLQFNASVGNGLSAAQAQERLAAVGANALVTTPPAPAWRHFLAQFQDPLVYLLLAAVAITLGVWALEGFNGWPIEGLVILVIVFANGVLGFAQETRSQRAAAALARLTATRSTVLRGGVSLQVPSAPLVPGDMLLLDEGDSIGADARLILANVLRVQEASLTGESEAVLKDPRTLVAVTPLAERSNMVWKGSFVAQGNGLTVVTATGMQTEMGAVAHLLNTTPEEATPLQKEVRAIGRMLGIAVVLIATIVVTAVVLVSDIRSVHDMVSVLLLGVSLAVAAERKLGVHEGRARRFERLAEIPFRSERRMMSVLVIDHAHADLRVIISKGAPDVLLGHCTRVRVGMQVLPLTDAMRARAGRRG